MIRRFLEIFSSLKLTVGVLLSLGCLVGYGTFFEVDPSTGAIRRDFYRSPGFLGILLVFGLNLLACTLRRAPVHAHLAWLLAGARRQGPAPVRPHQIGYLTTHAGLLLILAGALLTLSGGVEGSVSLPERSWGGEAATQDWFHRLDAAPRLEIAYLENGREVGLGSLPVWPAPPPAEGGVGRVGWIFFLLGVISAVLFLLRVWEKGAWYRPVPILFLGSMLAACAVRVLHPPGAELPRVSLPGGLDLEVVRSLPKAALRAEVRDGGPEPNPAAFVEVSSEAFGGASRWLYLNDPSRSYLAMGPLTVVLVPGDVPDAFAASAARREGEIAFPGADGKETLLPVSAARADWQPLPGGGGELRVDGFFCDLQVDPAEEDPDERFTNGSEDPANPAVLLRLRERNEESLFLLRPDASPERVEGTGSLPAGTAFRFDARAFRSHRGAFVLIAPAEGGGFRYLYTNRSGESRAGTLAVGEAVRYELMPMPLFFKVSRAAERAFEETSLVPTEHPDAGAGLSVRLTRAGRHREVGVLLDEEDRGGIAAFEGEEGARYRLAYRHERAPLGFSITLEDFRKVDYPGTEMASSFESEVSVRDPRKGDFAQVVRVNHPLVCGGFTLFQSSYMVDGEGRERSVFAVAMDPGVRAVYTGFVVFCVGLVMIFYLKPVLLRRERPVNPA